MKPIGGHSLSISTYSSSSKTNTAMFFQEKNGSVSFMGLTGQARPMPNNSGSIMWCEPTKECQLRKRM